MVARFALSLAALALVSQACHSKTSQVPETAGTSDGSVTVTGGGPSVTPDAAKVALGDKIFNGSTAGGTCWSCHGSKAKGTPSAPKLSDAEWLDTDGSLEGIKSVIEAGVPTPKKFSVAMPPKGNMPNMTDEQLDALAAYVYSLSHK
jgi:mono/diheme cytochrome c family protein